MSGMIKWLGALVLVSESIALHAATISGVVRGPGGYPLDQSVVWAVTEDCLESRRAVSDKQGHYSFEQLPSGTYEVFGTSLGLWQIRESTVSMGSESTNNVDLQLVISEVDTGGSPPSVPINGVITDAGNRPIAGARITHSGRERENEVSSNGDGRFGFCRVSGERVELRIEHQEFRRRRIKVDLGSGRNIDQLKITLRKR
jgi:Carboxypeptidase regulatory-like domain